MILPFLFFFFAGSRAENKLRIAPAATRCNMWVYNPHVDCTVVGMESYVKKIIENDEVYVEKPELKRTGSSAFIVTCARRHYETLLDPGSWEEHIRVRLYRSATQQQRA